MIVLMIMTMITDNRRDGVNDYDNDKHNNLSSDVFLGPNFNLPLIDRH